MRLQLLCSTLVIAFSAALTVVAGPAAAQAPAGDAQQGAHDFAICGACHQVGPTARNMVGPVLNGVVGRKAGTYPGFAYSNAMKTSGITWSVEKLQQYAANPQKAVPGNKMPFAGLHDATKVNNIIAYLAQFNEKGEKTP